MADVRASSFADHLSSALDGLARELPLQYVRLARALGARNVLIRASGETVGVRVRRERVYVETVEAACVELQTDLRTILDLADAHLSFEEAVWQDRVRLRGTIEDLLAFHDALMIYLHGAVRSPSSTARLCSFRTFVDRRPDEREIA